MPHKTHMFADNLILAAAVNMVAVMMGEASAGHCALHQNLDVAEDLNERLVGKINVHLYSDR
jgi:hypothetical protein